jgi:hypothetical protein
MKAYTVTITKYGTETIEANSLEEAEEIARDQEAEGAFFMNIDVVAEEQK